MSKVLDREKIHASTETWQRKFWNRLSGVRQESQTRRRIGRDLDCKIQEYKEAGKTFPESQIIEWFIQLLLGVDYMHERKILHRDLKSKNIFLKNNKLKIGDFGVSRLLMGSCDLATTLTGTPHYMSPEALKHQGYDTKSDIWSLACILYEMCCMNHAFTGSNFLSIVLKIVEGDTPSLPERYPRQLNAIMESMLNKSPSLRPSAIEILKLPYIDEQLQDLMCRYSEMALEDKNLNSQEEATYIINAVQKKIHLQTLRALSEVQKMTPRERMRVRKVQAADEEARKLKKLVEEKYEENNKRMRELRSRNFQRQTVDVLHECDDPASDNLPESQPIPSLDLCTLGSNVEDTIADLGDHEIPEDPLVAEEYYADVFDSCSEESEESEEGKTVFSVKDEEVEDEGPQPVYRTNQQDSDTEALARCLEHVLGCTTLGVGDQQRGEAGYSSVLFCAADCRRSCLLRQQLSGLMLYGKTQGLSPAQLQTHPQNQQFSTVQWPGPG
nr:PREDICTED: serine/threonine-protein kinase Nek11 isoform X5 [Bos indicus]XP_019818188.1 PREDICTED: serine/threonine-protein kinase Nek11 isoform X5 [Bos indicus]